jgi:DNA polymerase-1
MNEKAQHLVLIDGYGFVFRAFHAFPPLTREDGVNVGAVFGFTSMLTKILLEFSCSHLAVVLDSGGKTFRHQIYPEYKSHRPPAPPELIPQFPLVREAISSLNIDILEKPGFEADDLIATFAKTASNQGLKVTIISSDKDLMQLIDDNISMFDPLKSKHIGAEQVIEKFGVKPEQVIDILALIGDSADYIPGVPGIGPKTASELIQKYSNIDGIYKNLSEIPASKRKQSLIDNKDLAILSHKLVILDDQVPTLLQLDDIRIKISHVDQFKVFLHQQNFKSLYDKAEKICYAFHKKNEQHHNPINNIKIIEINSKELLKDWLKSKVSASGQLILLLEAGFLCISCDSQETAIIDYNNQSLFDNNELNLKDLAHILEPYINDSSVIKILHDAKCFYSVLSNYCKIDDSAWEADDIQLISYVLNSSLHSHDLKTLIEKYYPLESGLELKQFLAYSTMLMLQLWQKFKQRLVQEKLLILYERIEKPLSAVLYRMEKVGIKINRNKLKELSADFSNRSAKLEQEIYTLSNHQFNLSSPKQLAEVLFNKLNLPSKNAKNSTNAEVLEELAAQGHTIADKILSWRHLTKLNNTYTNSLDQNADSDDRIHTNFQMTITSTGRLSSINPNLQNIPTRSEDGIKIRSVFIPKENHLLISADYSQIELRLLAHVADISSLKQAFAEGSDIHSATASEIFGIKLTEVTPELRHQAKAINFGIIYGISGFGLANQLRIPRKEASHYIEKYLNRYPEIVQYMEKTKRFAQENGFVETILGRRCYIKSINDPNPAIRNFSERAAINAPLQGSSADIIKKAMIHLDREIKKQKITANILLQVHDELLLEVELDALEEVTKLTKKIMESVISLSVPLTINVKTGRSWAEL